MLWATNSVLKVAKSNQGCLETYAFAARVIAAITKVVDFMAVLFCYY